MTQPGEVTLQIQPRIRKGAFFDAALRHGCRRFSVYNRTYSPNTFTNPVDEYWSVTRDVAIWPVMGERQVEISGAGAAEFVQFLTPRDMGKCAVGQCKYALITTPDGGILSDPVILKLADDRFWLSTSDCDLELWAKGVAVNAPMDVEVRDAGVSVVQVQGPKSPRLMVELFGEAILDLKYYRHTPADFQGRGLIISRTGWSGEFGYEIYLGHADQGDALFEALLEAGRPCGAAPGSVNQARRIEAGLLSWGVDMTTEENPYEVGLGRLVELDHPSDFIGRGALTRLRDQPPERSLVGMTIPGGPLTPNRDVWPLSSGGNAVGKLTSLAYSPRLETNIALGLAAAGFSDPGGTLDVATQDGPRRATIVELPFTPKHQTDDPRDLLASAAA